ncbi:hypothetical protein Tco_0526950 [Tanacetum coccineum]
MPTPMLSGKDFFYALAGIHRRVTKSIREMQDDRTKNCMTCLANFIKGVFARKQKENKVKNNLNSPAAVEAIVAVASAATSVLRLEVRICIRGLCSVITSGLCQQLWSGSRSPT